MCGCELSRTSEWGEGQKKSFQRYQCFKLWPWCGVWAGKVGNYSLFYNSNKKKNHFLPFLLLRGSSASADRYSPYQLPGVGAGHRQNQTRIAGAPAWVRIHRSKDTFNAIDSWRQAWLVASIQVCQGTCMHCSIDMSKPSCCKILELF